MSSQQSAAAGVPGSVFGKSLRGSGGGRGWSAGPLGFQLRARRSRMEQDGSTSRADGKRRRRRLLRPTRDSLLLPLCLLASLLPVQRAFGRMRGSRDSEVHSTTL
ncbi:hypothetical protein ISCGN_011933 [Ixodes scapularis]